MGGTLLKAKSDLFSPYKVRAQLFSPSYATNEHIIHQWTTALLGLAMLAAIFIITLEYWWWGTLYLRTGLVLWISLYAALVIPSLWHKMWLIGSLRWLIWVLLGPVCLCLVIMLIFRLGITDYTIHRYFYRSTWLMVFSSGLGLWALSWRVYSYRSILILSQRHRLVRFLIQFFMDAAFLTGFIIMITNIESITYLG